MLRIDRLSLIDLGIEQEQNSKIIEIDVKPWLKKMPGAAFTIVATRPGESTPYLAVSQLEDGVLRWTVTAGDLGVAGKYGKCDIRAYETDGDGTEKIKKTAVILTTIGDTLPGTTQAAVPEASKGWVDKAAESAQKAETAAASIKALKAKAVTLEAGKDATAAYDGDTGEMTIGVPKGENGVSPSIQVSKSGKVATVTITDKDGTKTVEIRDGNDGSGAGDMLKATYDTNNDGIVDKAADADKLGGKLPSAYAAAQHSHEMSDVTGLAAALAGKAASQHSHQMADVTGLETALAGKAASQHSHGISDVTGLETALGGKAAQSDLTALQTTVAGKATRQLLTATLSTEWAGSAAPYTQTVAVSGVLSTDAPVIDLVASETPATAEAELEAYGMIYLITTANGSITAYASDKPGTALTLQLLIVR